jgi:hypothetical protein
MTSFYHANELIYICKYHLYALISMYTTLYYSMKANSSSSSDKSSSSSCSTMSISILQAPSLLSLFPLLGKSTHSLTVLSSYPSMSGAGSHSTSTAVSLTTSITLPWHHLNAFVQLSVDLPLFWPSNQSIGR